MHTLNFSAYCGMTMKIAEGDSDTVRKAAARILRHRRNNDFPIWCLEKGNKWEIGEPEGCMMVPDDSGILKITEEVEEDDTFDDSMDGDFDSGMRDAGFGTDEDYGYYGDDF